MPYRVKQEGLAETSWSREKERAGRLGEKIVNQTGLVDVCGVAFYEFLESIIDSTAKTLPLDREAERHVAIASSPLRLSFKPPYICAPFTQTLSPKMTDVRLGGGFCSGIIIADKDVLGFIAHGKIPRRVCLNFHPRIASPIAL
ncbi:MAG: hypothetical protein LBR80_10150 [Deltaproteobacteria bacterium]|jgi:hypothetical protein|nr:hypothetical protein [Deltaproteobacteria bacterium]